MAYSLTCISHTQLKLTNDFVFDALLDNVNLLKLRRHILSTRLVNKIGGFAESRAKKSRMALALEYETKGSKQAPVGQDTTAALGWQEATHSLRCLVTLLTCLMNADADGRVVLSTSKDSSTNTNTTARNLSIRFILLNPSVYFKQVVEQARSVVLLGGTMKPFAYVRSFLFPSLSDSRIRLFSCGHGNIN